MWKQQPRNWSKKHPFEINVVRKRKGKEDREKEREREREREWERERERERERELECYQWYEWNIARE